MQILDSLRRRFARVHNRYLFFSFVILFMAMFLLAVFISYQFRDILLTETQERGEEFGRNLRATFTPLLVTYNYASIYSYLETMVEQQDILYLAVYDKELTLAACNDYYRENQDAILRIRGTELKYLRQTAFTEGQIALPGGRKNYVLDIQAPVFIKPSTVRWGIIHAGLSLDNMYAHLHQIHIFILVSFLVALVVTYLGLQQVARMIRQPMDTLLAGARKLATGDLNHHFDLEGTNEFGTLAQSFNQMVSEVQLLQNRLEDWNRELEQRVAERTAALQETRQFLENVFNSLAECIITIDRKGILTYANARFFEISGFTRDDLGKPFTRLFLNRGLSRTRAFRTFIRCRRGESIRWEQAMLFNRRELLLELAVSPLHSLTGPPLGLLVIGRDITRQREIEQQLQHARKMEIIGGLAGSLAHDFNNLLGAILPAVELLKQDLHGPEDRRRIEIVEHSAHRAADLIAQLLSVARQRELPLMPLDLNEIIQSVLATLASVLAPDLRLQVRLDSEPVQIQGNRNMLEQFLSEVLLRSQAQQPHGGEILLITDRFQPDDGFLRLHPEVPIGDYVQLRIMDTVTGVEEQYFHQLYDPFFTATGGTADASISDSLVYGAIKKHNGYIFWSAQPDRGTTIQILLPALAPDVPFPASAERLLEAATPMPRGHERVLVVDDEDMVREVARDLLAELGYEVDSVSSGQEAVRLIQSAPERFDLIILDMVMPGMDGLETIGCLRRIRPDLRVILVSGYDSDEKIRRALQSGYVEFMQKPYKINDLATLVRRILQSEKPPPATP